MKGTNFNLILIYQIIFRAAKSPAIKMQYFKWKIASKKNEHISEIVLQVFFSTQL